MEPASAAQWPAQCSAEPLAAIAQHLFAPTSTLAAKVPSLHLPVEILVHYAFGLANENMRTVIRFLAVFTIAALLTPGARWAAVRVQAEACACPPASCVCSGHRHTPGHISTCNMKDGGRCGIGSQDDYLSSALATLNYLPTEYAWANPPAPWRFNHDLPDAIPLPSHARIPDQPPRPTL